MSRSYTHTYSLRQNLLLDTLAVAAIVLSCLFLFSSEAHAQANSTICFTQPTQQIPQPCPVDPNGAVIVGQSNIPPTVNSVQVGTTIAVTNTFQLALAASGYTPATMTALAVGTPRRACLLQNKGSNNMFVYFLKTGAAAATLAASLVITPGQSVNCQTAGSGVLQDAIYITGTATDSYSVVSQ
jgi:hypothetical protein